MDSRHPRRDGRRPAVRESGAAQAHDEVQASGAANHESFRTRTFDMGSPTVDLDKALAVAGDLEDAALVAEQER